MALITIAPPKFQVGQRINTPYNESGVILGASYIFHPTSYDVGVGWSYLIEFQRRSPLQPQPLIFCDSLHESDLERWQQKTIVPH